MENYLAPHYVKKVSMSTVALHPGILQLGDHVELACGCFVCPETRVKQVLQVMPKPWKKRSASSITSFNHKECAGLKAIHLTPMAACEIILGTSKETLEIVESILAIHGTRWQAGVRVGEC